jgi:hypothetical protein
MRKSDNEWSVTTDSENLPRGSWNREVMINGTIYLVDENTACLSHSLLLLLDAINDKDFK